MYLNTPVNLHIMKKITTALFTNKKPIINVILIEYK